MSFDQAGYDVRCEWGENGIRQLALSSDAVVIVDVLSFSTCVDVAVSRGGKIFPFHWNGGSAGEFAADNGAILAGPREGAGLSLSPASLLHIKWGTRVVLPSPNGSTLSLSTGATPTFTGCFRNADAVARAACRFGPRVAVIPAGERWHDGSLRPCLEDWLGAGAIVASLSGSRSPEAGAASESFDASKSDLKRTILDCSSGRELMSAGYVRDIELASELMVSSSAPRLVNGAYVDVSNGGYEGEDQAGSERQYQRDQRAG